MLTSSTCSHNVVNFSPLMAETSSGVWAPQHISIGFAFCLHYCSDVACRKPTKLRTMFGRLLGWYIDFWRLLPPGIILPGAEFTLHPSLLFSYIGSITARDSSSGRQPNCGVVQGMELRNFRRGRHLFRLGSHHVRHRHAF